MLENLKIIIKSLINKKFVTILGKTTNLVMIEAVKEKKVRNITKTKEWQKLLEVEIDKLINLFTYKEWLVILSNDNMYTKESKNKTIDIKINLTRFLTKHYVSLYKLFDMEVYNLYQTKSKSEIYSLILIENVYLGEIKVNAILINYKDGSRMCYNPETKLRIMVENLEMQPESVIITLVDMKYYKNSKLLSLLKSIFSEEE